MTTQAQSISNSEQSEQSSDLLQQQQQLTQQQELSKLVQSQISPRIKQYFVELKTKLHAEMDQNKAALMFELDLANAEVKAQLSDFNQLLVEQQHQQASALAELKQELEWSAQHWGDELADFAKDARVARKDTANHLVTYQQKCEQRFQSLQQQVQHQNDVMKHNWQTLADIYQTSRRHFQRQIRYLCTFFAGVACLLGGGMVYMLHHLQMLHG
ncbi:hypothetical protein NFHSH190041_01430 [Shewanella sp. NFH-SH190041]|uniref:hypothetical protein n=1 Tax=Shewanella sp. NFH-SH190041 TaxID=2950245 RepID=UPI0021C35886|nr:hypothetical protein [Shewanella sp. NFH-SH190041]BDM62691.1 hypothetical protein NFHSH190041_01430 [Shewanella sp. NFH-SH190041]